MRRKLPWAALPEDKLLKVKLRSLKLTIENTWLEGIRMGFRFAPDDPDVHRAR